VNDDQACVMPHSEREPALDGLLLCRRHRRRMDDDVSEIGLLIVDTQRITDGGAPQDSGPRGGKSKKRADPPAPGDVAIMALYDRRNAAARLPGDDSEPVPAVLAVVASWTLLLAEERPLTATLPRSVLAQLDLLRRHHEWIAAQLYVDDYLLEMAELRKALVGVVRDVRYERRGVCALPLEDTVCGGVLLEENGTRAVYCTRCRARWVTDQELARLAVTLESA
jgi:hypothetical protein